MKSKVGLKCQLSEVPRSYLVDLESLDFDPCQKRHAASDEGPERLETLQTLAGGILGGGGVDLDFRA